MWPPLVDPASGCEYPTPQRVGGGKSAKERGTLPSHTDISEESEVANTSLTIQPSFICFIMDFTFVVFDFIIVKIRG